MSHRADRHSDNPLSNATQAGWDRLIQSVNPASMLVAIDGMLGSSLSSKLEPEDVWQETLLMAWRDRGSLEWRGYAAFRRWLLSIARNRIRDFAERASAAKRGGGRELHQPTTRSAWSGSEGEHFAGPIQETTPSRVATDRETAALMRAALGSVPEEYRAVVHFRLFEDLEFGAVGQQLGLSAEAARYRFARGVEVYRRELRRLRAHSGLSVRSSTTGVGEEKHQR